MSILQARRTFFSGDIVETPHTRAQDGEPSTTGTNLLPDAILQIWRRLHNKQAEGSETDPSSAVSSSSTEENESTTSTADPVIRLNIGGQRFILLKASLQKYPNTVLGKLALFLRDNLSEYAPCHAVLQPDNELFFDRPGTFFAPIAQMYQTGHLHRPPVLCSKAFKDELVFWVLQGARARGKSKIRPLREKTTSVAEGKILVKLRGDKLHGDDTSSNSTPTDDGTLYQRSMATSRRPHELASQQYVHRQSLYQRIKSAVWENMEGQNGGRIAVGINMASIILILLNLALMILDSLPGYHYLDYADKIIAGVDTTNGTTAQSNELTYSSVMALYVMDWACTVIFTLELLIRLWAAPSLIKVIKDPMVIIDILSILPSYIEAIVSAIFRNHVHALGALQVLRALRSFRIFRILKLARFQSGFQIIGKCMTESIPEFILLLFHLFVATLMAGSLLYYIELTAPAGAKTPYKTIPDGIYWAIVTYFSFADAPPVTTLGKVAATVACVLGIVLMALPVSVVVDKFSHFFAEARKAVPESKK